MQEPDFLPNELKFYAARDSDKELFLALTRHFDDLLAFFEYGCEDAAWCARHPAFIRSVMRWGAKQLYLGRLSLYDAKRLAALIQLHYGLLEPFLYFQPALFFTIHLEIEGHWVIVNSLLFGTSSSFFYEIFKRCFDELNDRWILAGTSLAIFTLIQTYILKGEIADLWRQEYPELLALMRQAKAWDLPGLVKDCAKILSRYITRDNVVQTLLEAHRQFFVDWKEECCHFFNRQGYGLRFLPIEHDADLRIEILDYKQSTLEQFTLFAPWLTHLMFSENLSKDPLYANLVSRCPKLIGIDLSGSFDYVDQFSYLPKSLIELNLSSCPWVRPFHLQEASRHFPGLKKLNLDGNLHLNYQTWGEFNRFRQLISLSLSRCHQVKDDDLKLIGRSCPHLIELNLEECRYLTDKGIADLISACPQLHTLTLSYCPELTDNTLIELGLRAFQLEQLSIRHCSNLGEAALLQFIRLRSTLKELDIQGCEFSLQAIEKIRKEFPFLKLI
ncbi:hypothetical protein [Candidatus Protochlamydia phocaeensis]|uniref:hypothetical protein n=1 Tax=Candidatus Protochlamydia phocaeensis TaxID=1414722 RepID=UPI0008388CC0|nr:hypothetical protein [Candidatus Protochlamydia phocaeensis]